MNPTSGEQQVAINKGREELCRLVYSTLKNIVYVDTEVSDDGQDIIIKLNFGSQCAIIPISIKDIRKNLSSGKGFVELITNPLEDLITPR